MTNWVIRLLQVKCVMPRLPTVVVSFIARSKPGQHSYCRTCADHLRIAPRKQKHSVAASKRSGESHVPSNPAVPWLRYCGHFAVGESGSHGARDLLKSMAWSFGSVIVAEIKYFCHSLGNFDVISLYRNWVSPNPVRADMIRQSVRRAKIRETGG